VIQWRAVGDRLRLSVNNSITVQEDVKASLSKAGAEIRILREARITMEDVFIYLVETQENPT
jgi:tmRNA-binding protein